jgi:cell wall-associated NlpC family hydrolase
VRARARGTRSTLAVALVAMAFPTVALGQDQGGTSPAEQPSQAPSSPTGGREYGTADPAYHPTVEGSVAQIVDGVAFAPTLAPPAVQQAIWAANQIVGKPYIRGGGHNRTFKSAGYDCSGTVSFALHGGGLLRRARDSSSFMRYGAAGVGQWITIYTNPAHAYMTIAGIRLDTSAADDPSGLRGPRWRPLRPTNRGFKIRHPVGL